MYVPLSSDVERPSAGAPDEAPPSLPTRLTPNMLLGAGVVLALLICFFIDLSFISDQFDHGVYAFFSPVMAPAMGKFGENRKPQESPPEKEFQEEPIEAIHLSPPDDGLERSRWFKNILQLDSSSPLINENLRSSEKKIGTSEDFLPKCTAISSKLTRSLLRFNHFIQRNYLELRCSQEISDGPTRRRCSHQRNFTQEFQPRWVFYGRNPESAGGLGDRLKGIFNALMISFISQRGFGIHHEDPGPWREVLDYNILQWADQYPWYKSSHYHYPSKFPTEIDSSISSPEAQQIINWMMKPDLGYPIDYQTAWADKEKVEIYSNMNSFPIFWRSESSRSLLRSMGFPKNSDLVDVYSCLFQYLFQLNEKYRGKYRRLLKVPGEFKFRDHLQPFSPYKLICLQYRQGRAEGTNFRDTETITPASAYKAVRDRIYKLPFYGDENTRVFVTTDNENARQYFLKAFPSKVLEFPGPLVHVDRSRKAERRAGWSKTVMDFYMLGECLYSIVSDSGFGSFGIWRNGQWPKRPHSIKRITRKGKLQPYAYKKGDQK